MTAFCLGSRKSASTEIWASAENERTDIRIARQAYDKEYFIILMNVIILRLFIRGLGKRRPLILRISLKFIDWHVEKC